jgi:GTP-binding protein
MTQLSADPAMQAAKELSATLFSKPWVFIRGVPSLKFLPPEGPPESCLCRPFQCRQVLADQRAGRRQGTCADLQHAGPHPGAELFRSVGLLRREGDLPPMALVDMPGYGYAKAPKDQVDLWTKLVFDYMRGRSTLKRVYLLIDSRHGLKKNDEEVMDLLDKAAMSYQVVLTKTDKIKAAGVPRLISETLSRRSSAGRRPIRK